MSSLLGEDRGCVRASPVLVIWLPRDLTQESRSRIVALQEVRGWTLVACIGDGYDCAAMADDSVSRDMRVLGECCARSRPGGGPEGGS